MNNKGQIIFKFMLFSLVLLFAIIIISPIKSVIEDSRGDDGLQCSLSTLTVGTALTCIVTDLILPYFILTAVLVGGGIVQFKQ